MLLFVELIAAAFLWWFDAAGVYEISLVWILAPLWVPWLIAWCWTSTVASVKGSKKPVKRRSSAKFF